MKIAVLGAGISGLGAAYLLSKKHEVDLYEKEARLGGHARTSTVHEGAKKVNVDTGFLVFNHETYPLLTKLFEELNVEIVNSNMSFAFWHKEENYAYNGESIMGMFHQFKNIFSPQHYKMILDILRFNEEAKKALDKDDLSEEVTLKEFLKNYSEVFKSRYIIPMGSAIWSTPTDKMLDFPAKTFLSFFNNHGLLGVDDHHQWLTVKNGSINYVNKVAEKISGKIIYKSDVIKVKRNHDGIILIHEKGNTSYYDKVILAMHAPQALAVLDDASNTEKEILEAFSYKPNKALLHNDTHVLHGNTKQYAAWNYTVSKETQEVTLTYYINKLQPLVTKKDYFVSLNETSKLNNVIEEVEYEHPQFDKKAIAAQKRHNEINGKNNTYYAGAYWRYGFHEDGLYSANVIAKDFGCAL